MHQLARMTGGRGADTWGHPVSYRAASVPLIGRAPMLATYRVSHPHADNQARLSAAAARGTHMSARVPATVYLCPLQQNATDFRATPPAHDHVQDQPGCARVIKANSPATSPTLGPSLHHHLNASRRCSRV